ncbi:hypothetical protein LZ318_17145 [Saccharopolyspora indica]|uniref:hypothetical protein n=1 Tax=Saccharopolyspora indica TaxID=1229659 RepID=UPI0022EAB097|nr:hypothetical protein [Saccharopolyspora indica]MDA3648592.1 hypothetical protein [Saccharopolyspora indica]
MDELEYMDRVEALIDAISERSHDKLSPWLSSYTRAGEHTLALDSLAYALLHRKVPITRAESTELRSILYEHDVLVPGMDSINDRDNVMASLNIIEDAPERDVPEPPAASGVSVVVHENPDFARTMRTQVGLHVDLPPRLYEPFVDHFTANVGVGVEINLARTNPDEYVRQGKLHEPTTLESNFVPLMIQTISDGSIWGGGILLRGFEQWWTKKRTQAKDLVRQIPIILATEQLGDDNFHIALADMSSATADQVITMLTEAEHEPVLGPVPPVPVFRYPPM